MAKKPSVAPQERINIRYSPKLGDAAEQVELPLVMMMMGDYTLRDDATPIAEREVLDVTKNTFDKVMEAQKLELALQVPDRLSGSGADQTTFKLAIKNLKDMTPDGIVKGDERLSKMADVRAQLESLKGPLGSRKDFRVAIEQLFSDEARRTALLDAIAKSSESDSGGKS